MCGPFCGSGLAGRGQGRGAGAQGGRGQAGAGSARSRASTSGSTQWPGGSRSTRWRAWRISRPGTAISRHRRVAIMALPPRTPCPARMSSPSGDGGELVQPGGHARGEQRAPHPGQVHLGISGGKMPESSAELAVTEDVLHRGAVPVPVLHSGRLVRGGHVQVGQDERVGVDRPGTGQLGERQGALVRVQGAAPPGARVGRDLLRVQRHPADQQPGVRRPPVRAVPGDGDLGAVHVYGIVPVRPRRGRPAAATAARSAWRRSRSRCARRGRRGPARRRSIRRRRASPPVPKPVPAAAGRPGRGAADPARSRAGHRSRRPGRRPAQSRSPPSWPRAAGRPAGPGGYRPRRASCGRRPPRRWCPGRW